MDEATYESIKDSRNIELIPIVDWLYEAIGTNSKIEEVAQITERMIPVRPPINLSSCESNLEFRHLDNLWYNQLVLDYINNILSGTITIGVLDTGIDGDHSFLWQNIMNPLLVAELTNWDSHGHGTHIAGIIKQLNNRASILPIKVSDWESDEVSNINFIKWLALVSTSTWIDILNLSLWWYEFYEKELELIKKIVWNKTLIIASAGNDWLDTAYTFPAWHKEVISVWSNDFSSNPSIFSNYDPNIRAPWECIYSTLPNNWWWFADGTSMAAPMLAWYAGLHIMKWKSIEEIVNIYKQQNKFLDQEKVYDILGIKTQNDSFAASIDTIVMTLTSISNQTIELKNKISGYNTNSTIKKDYTTFKNSVRSELSKTIIKAKEIESIYSNLWIKGGAWENVIDYITTLSTNANNILNFDAIILPTNKLWELVSGLWIGSCAEKTLVPNWQSCWLECKEIKNLICDIFDPIIPRGVSLPYESGSSYVTINDNQSDMNISIYQWDTTFTKDTKKLWEIIINNLPMKQAGETSVKVFFSIDKGWVLSVKAVDEANKNNYKTAIIKQGIDYNIEQDGSESNLNEILQALWTLESQLSFLTDYLQSLKSYRPTNQKLTQPPIEVTQESADYTNWYVVSRVIDWDTIDIIRSGDTVRIRLIGIDAPEYNSTRNVNDCFWKEATEFLTNKVKDKYINLEYDNSQWTYDKYGRELAYLFLWSENINKSLIEWWYAHEYTYNKPYKYTLDFNSISKIAKEKQLGLWWACR